MYLPQRKAAEEAGPNTSWPTLLVLQSVDARLSSFQVAQGSKCSFELWIDSGSSSFGFGSSFGGSVVMNFILKPSRCCCSNSLFGGDSSHADGGHDEQEFWPMVVENTIVGGSARGVSIEGKADARHCTTATRAKHCIRAYMQITINSVAWFSGLDSLIQGVNNELTANLDEQTLASHRLPCCETGALSHVPFPP